MKARDFSRELKVGLVVLFGIALLFYMSFRVGKLGFVREKGYEIFVLLDDATGLDPKTPVRIAGVEVGRIRRIELSNFKARAVLLIDSRFSIPRDSALAVRSQGILGDRYLEIIPGKEGVPLRPAEEIRFLIRYPQFEEIMKNIDEASKGVAETLYKLRGIVGEKEKASLRRSLINFEVASSQIKEIASENREGIREVVNKAKEVSQKVAEITGRIEEGTGTIGMLLKDEQLYRDSRELVASLKETSEGLKKGTLGRLMEDESVYLEAKKVIEDASQIVEGIKKGEGTLGKLVKDESLYEETKQTIEETRRTVKNIQRAAKSVEEQTPVSIIGTIMRLLF